MQESKVKVYVCQVCNAYLPEPADASIPICCGKAMICMDEMDESEVKYRKESSAGL